MAKPSNKTLDASVPGRTPAQIAYTKRRREAAKAAGIVPPPQARRKFLLPANDWKPREYQLPTWRALQSGIKRVVSVWHRRAGKDDVALHWTACSAFRRPGVYWHMLPQAAQARKAIWSAVNPHTGKRRIDEAFPLDIRKSTRENEMSIEFANGALWQVVGSDNYDCYSDDTEVLTDNGWCLISELTGLERVATLAAGDEMVFAPINAVVDYPFDGLMYQVKNSSIDLLTTPNHKFYVESSKGVRKFKRIDDPTIEGDKIPAVSTWRGIEQEEYTLHGISARSGVWKHEKMKFAMHDWCAFMGIFLSEGSTFSDKQGNYRVIISQKKAQTCREIAALLERMGLKARYDKAPGNFVVQHKLLFDYVSQFGLCHQKFVPRELKALGAPYIQTLTDWMVKGDGHITRGGTLSYASTSQQLAGDFQELMLRLGVGGNVRVIKNRGGMIRGRQITSTLPLWVFNRRTSKFKHFRDSKESYISKVPYKGRVWCIDAGSHVIKVRRNGFEAWCGNSLVGSPPVGVTFSEWALADPNAWTYLRPILAENGGWAWFVYTPRGQNHAAKFYANAKTDPTWYAELLRARDTGVFTAEQLAQELRELQRDLGSAEGQARFDQEYDCDFSSSVPGAYYGEAMTAVDREGRATAVPLTPGVPVHTAWDLGYGDQMFVWLFQVVGFSYRFLKVIYNSSKGIDYYVGEMQKWSAGKPVVWGTHLWPHDGGHGNIATGATYQKTALDLGLNPLIILDRTQNVDVDINVARQALASCWFDADGCEFGLNALRNYGREWDDEKKVFANKPRHDWASHPADAFRAFAVGRHRLRSALNGPQRSGMSSHDMASRMPSIGVA